MRRCATSAIDRDDIERVVGDHLDAAGEPCCGYPFAAPAAR